MNKQELAAMVAQILSTMDEPPMVKATEYHATAPQPEAKDTGYTDGDFVPDVTQLDLRKLYLTENPENEEKFRRMKERTPARLGSGKALVNGCGGRRLHLRNAVTGTQQTRQRRGGAVPGQITRKGHRSGLRIPCMRKRIHQSSRNNAHAINNGIIVIDYKSVRNHGGWRIVGHRKNSFPEEPENREKEERN